jgi:hypothetical protein
MNRRRALRTGLLGGLGVTALADGSNAGEQDTSRAAHRYPEFVEVGPAAWAALVEWHVRERQTLGATRLADGRYTMTFNFSTVVLRPDLDDTYISIGYDGDRRP